MGIKKQASLQERYVYATIIDITIIIVYCIFIFYVFMHIFSSFDVAFQLSSVILILLLLFRDFAAFSIGPKLMRVSYEQPLTISKMLRKNLFIFLGGLCWVIPHELAFYVYTGIKFPIRLSYMMTFGPFLILLTDLIFGLGLKLGGIKLQKNKV